MIGNYRVREFS